MSLAGASEDHVGELNGLNAVVVGARNGVGPEVVLSLQAQGAAVITDASIIDASRDGLTFVNNPVSFFDRCEAVGGPCSILVICAPPVKSKPVLEMTADELRFVAEEELVLPALYMQEAARRMVKRDRGRIIVFASMSAKTGVHHNVAPYAAAKGGLLAFMRVLAAEVAEHGVTVNAVATALFEPQVATMPEEKRAKLQTEIPVGRFGRSEEAAHAVLFLASAKAGYVTGECLNLSGGRFMD